MTIQSYIANMRTKTERERRKAAFWWAFGFTALVAVFWLGSITGINIQSGAAVAAVANKAGTPAQSMVAAVGGFAGDIWSIISGPMKVTYSEVQVTPGVK